MKEKTNHWVAAFAVGFMLLIFFGGQAIPAPKARAHRFQGVNSLARPFPRDFVITNIAVTNGAYLVMTK